MEDAFPSDFAPERLAEQGRIETERRNLPDLAEPVCETPDQLTTLIRHLDCEPPPNRPSVADPAQGRQASAPKDANDGDDRIKLPPMRWAVGGPQSRLESIRVE